MSGLLGRLLRSPLERLERVLRETGKVEKLRLLLERFPHVLDVHNLVFKGGFSALQLCSLHGHAACVAYLISQQRVNVHHVNPLDNSTALHVGACGGSLEVVQALVELGNANVNCVTEMGFTPLHYAVLGGKTDVYVYLISTGLVDVSFRNSDGITPLLLASRSGQLKPVQYLIEFAAVNIEECDNNGCTSLHYACSGGCHALVMYLVGSGALATARDAKGRLPVDLTKDAAIKTLLAGGAAGGGGHSFHAEFLRSAGGESFRSRDQGSSPRTSIASTLEGDRETGTLTTDSTYKYKVVDSIYSKLQVVCKSGQVSELESIVTRRPDLNSLEFPGGWGCLHLCAQHNQVQCLDLLLFKTNVDIDKENKTNGVTALHIACRNNCLPGIKVLLRGKNNIKANVNCRTFKGKVPLHFAVMHGDKSTCAYLLAQKADTFAQDVNGRTALMYAVRRRDLSIVELLMQYHADARIRDVKGRSAIDVARSRGFTDVVEKLGNDRTSAAGGIFGFLMGDSIPVKTQDDPRGGEHVVDHIPPSMPLPVSVTKNVVGEESDSDNDAWGDSSSGCGFDDASSDEEDDFRRNERPAVAVQAAADGNSLLDPWLNVKKSDVAQRTLHLRKQKNEEDYFV